MALESPELHNVPWIISLKWYIQTYQMFNFITKQQYIKKYPYLRHVDGE